MLGFILGPMLEENFRRALLLSREHFAAFFTRPISGTLLGLIGVFVIWQLTDGHQRSSVRGSFLASHRRPRVGYRKR